MKYYYMPALLMIVAIFGCKKNNAGNGVSPAIVPDTIRVLEKSTNEPIVGATVAFQKCTNYDDVFGCTSYSTIKTLTTNSLGQIIFSPPSIPGCCDALEVQRKKYWTTREKALTDIILIPKCTVIASIKKVSTYSLTDILYVAIREANCLSFLCFNREQKIGLPNDTVAIFTGAGNSNNQLSWYINFLSSDTLHSLPSFYVNRFDTARVNIEY